MELFAVALGAQVRYVNAFGRHTGGEQLEAIGAGEIDVRSSLLSEMAGDLRAYFITAFPNARADSRVDIGGRSSETGTHLIDRTGDDRGHRAAPPRVNRGNGAMTLVDQ